MGLYNLLADRADDECKELLLIFRTVRDALHVPHLGVWPPRRLKYNSLLLPPEEENKRADGGQCDNK